MLKKKRFLQYCWFLPTVLSLLQPLKVTMLLGAEALSCLCYAN